MPTVADVAPLKEILGHVLTGDPLTHGALTVTPLLAPLMSDPGWLTLAEAGERVRITEVSEGGSVPYLKAENLADQPVLLLDGEELVGAKQNRVLNTSVLIAARTEVAIPVSCVERGRWAYRGRHFAPSPVSLYASIRQKKAAWVTRNLRDRKAHLADQAEVWADIAAKQVKHDIKSETGAMRDFFAQNDDAIGKARHALAPVPGQVGAVVHLSGRWVGLDLLAGSRLFAQAWPRLCAGYAADALGEKPGRSRRPAVDTLLQMLLDSPEEPAPAVGLGEEHRLTGGKLAGAALVAEDRVAHLMAFPAVGEGPERAG
jgi:hypothetical protein